MKRKAEHVNVLITYPQFKHASSHSALGLGYILGLGQEACMCAFASIHVSVSM